MSMGAGKISQAISLAVATLAAGIMPAPLERDPARDEILRKMAAVAGERGWGMDVLLRVAGPDADLLFPGGSAELVEAWFDLCDRDMLEAMWNTEEEPRLSQRVRQALLYRLQWMRLSVQPRVKVSLFCWLHVREKHCAGA